MGGASTLIYSLCPSPPSTRRIKGASAPPHPANPSLTKAEAGGRSPSDARARAAAPGATLFPPAAGSTGTLSGRSGARQGEGGGCSTCLEAGGVGGRRSRAQDAGGSRPHLGALPRGACCWAAVPCSLRASLVSPRQSPRAGGCPGNGRAQVASATAPVYYGDSSYFLFGGLREIKKYISKVGGRESWAAARRRAAAQRRRGWAAAVTCFLDTRRKETQLIAALLWGVRKVGGVLTHATQRWGRGCGCRTA